MNETPHPNEAMETQPRFSWIKWLIIAVLLLIPAGLVLQVFIYFHLSGNSELRHAMEEADRLDPGWRLEELEAHRTIIPDADNSALLVRELAKSVPESWPRQEIHALWNPQLDLMKPLTPEQLAFLREQMKLVEAAAIPGRKLSRMPRGRFPITYTAGGVMGTLTPQVMEIVHVSNVMLDDALLRLEEGDADGALESVRAAINATTSIGDEPLHSSQFNSIGCRRYCFRLIERVLCRATPSEQSLAVTQTLLEELAGRPLLLIGVRGERAFADRTMEEAQNAGISLAQWGRMLPEDEQPTKIDFLNGIVNLIRNGSFQTGRAALLDFHNRVVEIAKRPVCEQREEFRLLQATIPRLPRFVHNLAPAATAILERFHRDLAETNSLNATIAVERYRLRHGQWPDKLSELVPAFLSKVPDDPFTKGPVFYRRIADGVVVYSAGPDGKNDGGKIFRNTAGAIVDADLGFELRDVEKRRAAMKPVLGPVTP